MDNLIVDFYDKTHAAVTVNWPDEPEYGIGSDSRKYYDAMIVACYIFRQIRNFRGQREHENLIISLSRWSLDLSIEQVNKSTENNEIQVHGVYLSFERSIFRVATDSGMDWEQAEARYGLPTYLVTPKGKGSRQFKAELMNPRFAPSLLLRTSGFGLGGLFGLEMGFYAPDSVHHVLTYLVKTYIHDKPFLESFRQAIDDISTELDKYNYNTVNDEYCIMNNLQRIR